MGAFGVNSAASRRSSSTLGGAAPNRARRRLAPIGKGITFDSGGLDLKTAEGMATMKGDMSGAAAVLGVLKVLPRLKPAIEVHGLVAATDNMPSGSATKPGDVLRAMNGKTIEVNNTDAEGRLTLADAIAYARQEIKPDEIVDIATLTGAARSRWQLCAGAMSNNARWRRGSSRRARAGERLWPLPLIDEYREGLRSEVADLRNTAAPGGAITAGLFIREFAGTRRGCTLTSRGAFSDKELRTPRRAGRLRACTSSSTCSPLPGEGETAAPVGGIDLHTHTVASDGTYTPAELVREAARRGVRVLAVTDHDSVEAVAPAIAVARDHPPLEIVPGIEINTDGPGGEIHVLGYFLDHEAEWLRDLLREFRAERVARVHRIADRLAELGHPIDAEEVFALVQEGSAADRTSPRSWCAGIRRHRPRNFFDRFLAAGKPATWDTGRSSREACGIIRRAGGSPSWRTPDFTTTGQDDPRARRHGALDGVECYYADTRRSGRRFRSLPGLVAPGGSDFHGPRVRAATLGQPPSRRRGSRLRRRAG